MSPSALIMLVIAETVITFFTIYFFWKAATMPPKAGSDSFSDNEKGAL